MKTLFLTMLITCSLISVSTVEPKIGAPQGTRPTITVVGDWRIQVAPGTIAVSGTLVQLPKAIILDVPPATLIHAQDEKYDSLALFNAQAAPWSKGTRLRPLITFETTASASLVPESLQLKANPNGAVYKRGTDYELDPRWATMGRLEQGIPADHPVWATYDYGLARLDAIIINRQGVVTLRQGIPHAATPLAPQPATDEMTLANIWIPARLTRLTNENIYPILATAYPEPTVNGEPPAAKLLPKTWAKLKHGEPLNILAWGDSVTAGGQVSTPDHLYQKRFLTLLQQKFPTAPLHLTTVTWGGRNSDSFLKEPPGSQYNFETAVLGAHPDLIVMEFVNDAWMNPEQVEAHYTALQQRFQAIGAEWIILTPHYVRPDWMGATTARVEQDPRPYVQGLRQFAARHNVALADASLRWGALAQQGIPYTTLLSNSINHPDDRGHAIFAAALMQLFDGRTPSRLRQFGVAVTFRELCIRPFSRQVEKV